MQQFLWCNTLASIEPHIYTKSTNELLYMTNGHIGGIGIDSCSKVSVELGASRLREILSVVTKGQQLVYGRTPVYFVSIDLSNNSLTGEIPTGITSLFALMNLNLPSKKIEWTYQT